ncbi:peptidoglycan recognition family protein [Streptomyces sp. RerS4]|uniref:peptidoglycan recognition protein family protein n=1 Tax=Streptomyces sp. RerS4 TaxID=2942449 RepID=UPI00201BCB24|nr:peptidoglycan recognition family protein [Streptomyces sp. RerS4]UQX01891.1 peptidoglycan recognition protein family protein [Streptomyces sp. RerS4]
MSSDSRRVVTRRLLLSGAMAAGALTLFPGPARAAPGAWIADCAMWGARRESAPPAVLATRPRSIVIHHTATANVADVTRERAFTLARSIQRHHMVERGWSDTGQHFTVSRGGFVVEGRHGSLAALRSGTSMVRGAHCTGHNDTSLGIETEGTYTGAAPPAAQYRALVELCARICHGYGLPPSAVHGHRDFNATQCPGDALHALLPRLREDVAAALSRR